MIGSKIKIWLKSLGCKVNLADAAELLGSLPQTSFEMVSDSGHADFAILNTCTVTHKADSDVRKCLGAMSRDHPDLPVIVTGCGAVRESERLLKFPNVRAVIRPGDRLALASALGLAQNPGEPARDVQSIFQQLGRKRAVLKVQDGCNARCAYCVVSMVRGVERSLEPEHAVQRLQAFLNAGHREVVISGVHLGRYGLDLQPVSSLAALVERLAGLSELTEGKARIRLSSIEPMEWSDTLIEVLADSPFVCPHFHIPVQSGEKDVLRRMRRPYGPSEVASILSALERRIRDVCIGTDLLAGFPGETDLQAKATLEWVKNLPFAYLHVFSFSERPGTEAAAMEPKVPAPIVHDRTSQLVQLGRRLWQRYLEAGIGQHHDVLLEKLLREGRWVGHSERYRPIGVFAQGLSAGQRVAVRAERLEGSLLLGVCSAPGSGGRMAGKQHWELIEAATRKLGYDFRQPSLLEQAITHSSYTNEASGTAPHNERLEFLGDAVLNLAIGEMLLRSCPLMGEGDLSRLRSALVNSRELCLQAERLGLGELLLLGKGEERSGGRSKPSLLANTLEAIIGAVYLDGGSDSAQRLVANLLGDRLTELCARTPLLDPKSALQELLQSMGKKDFSYHVVDSSGPPHQRKFVVAVSEGEREIARGDGKSKKEAERAAAERALSSLAQGDPRR